ncbi:hypothetical protein [Streptomyces sp. NPDC050416]|uniref:hypothetical protein n=1 Tax=Streptomyces sp. NPDC050416 TaxID=3365611 RepID=UPI0037919AD2
MLVSDSSQYTLPLGLQALFVSERRQYDLVLAGAFLAVLPAVAHRVRRVGAARAVGREGAAEEPV